MGGASSSQKVGDVGEYPINPLMCLSVAAILPHPILHAYLRSAGQTGLRVYEELITLRMIPCCLESPQTTEPKSPLRRPWSTGKRLRSTPQLIPIHIEAHMPQARGIGSRVQSVIASKKSSLDHNSTLVVFPDVAHRSGNPIFITPFPTSSPHIKCVRFCHDDNAERPPEFIRIPNAELVAVEGFNSVTSIGQQFHGYTMPNIDFSSLAHAERLFTISNNFLYQCRNVIQLDLTPFGNVTTIGDNFMCYCERLESIDLSPLSKVSAIGENFLAYTTGLRSVDFGGGSAKERGMGSNMTEIGDGFLLMATSLEKIDLQTFTNIKTIGKLFLSHCKSLRYVDLRPFGDAVESVGICLLNGCDDIKVDHPPQTSSSSCVWPKILSSQR